MTTTSRYPNYKEYVEHCESIGLVQIIRHFTHPKQPIWVWLEEGNIVEVIWEIDGVKSLFRTTLSNFIDNVSGIEMRTMARFIADDTAEIELMRVKIQNIKTSFAEAVKDMFEGSLP